MGTKFDLSQIPEDLENTSTLDELSQVAIRLRDRLEIEHIIYHWVDGAGDQYGYTTYPDAWAERYREKNYHRIDPVILGCFQRFHPVDWKKLDWSSKVAKAFSTGCSGPRCRKSGIFDPLARSKWSVCVVYGQSHLQ